MEKEILGYEEQSYLERCQRLIKGEKLAMKDLYSIRLTTMMISLISGIGYHTLTHLDQLSEDSLREHYKVLKRQDFGKRVCKKVKDKVKNS